MRLIACTCLAAVWMVLSAGESRADVVPHPIKVRIENGEVVVESKAPAVIEAIQLRESGVWRSASPAPGASILPDRETYRLPLAANEGAQGRRILIKYSYEGDTRTVDLDLDPVPRAIGTTTALPEGEPASPGQYDDSGPIPGRGPDPDLAGTEGRKGGPSASPQARNIRVHGRFTYRRPDGQVAGVDGATVRLYDDDAYLDEFLGSQVTDPQGYFDITFGWDPCWTCDDEPDIYADFELDNAQVQVQTSDVLETDYSWRTGAWGDFTGTDLYMGWQTPSAPNEFPACHIMTNVVRAWRFMTVFGWNTPDLDVQWPDDQCPTACYDPVWHEIHVPPGRQWDDATIVHEYGHHWVDTFGINTPPDYCNGICDNTGCGHCSPDPLTSRIAHHSC